jgi:PmbA protein
MGDTERNPTDLLQQLMDMAQAAGADQADAVHVEGTSVSVSMRLGELESLERSEGADIGLRVLVGQRQACVSSSDSTDDALRELAERAVSMAKEAPVDKFAGLAEPEQLAKHIPDIDCYDPSEPDVEQLKEDARRCEEAARSVEGITNSEGSDAGWGKNRVALAATNGFVHTYEGSYHSLSVSVLAGEGVKMERDYDYRTAVYASDIPAPETIGKTAAEKTLRRLNPQRIKTCKVPVVFDPRVANSMIGHFTGAINGASIARGTSFLKDQMGEAVFGENITITEDPHRPRGLRSKPFDAEGIANHKRNLIENGVLTTWLLDLGTARQLGLETTGHASRGTTSPPSPSATNLHMEPGDLTPEELIREVGTGLYVTELIGFGVNGVTGDYSRGAGGFWIENGEIAYPVTELTIAGNLKDMFKNLTPANDLEFRYGTNAPTIRIDGMTVAGG